MPPLNILLVILLLTRTARQGAEALPCRFVSVGFWRYKDAFEEGSASLQVSVQTVMAIWRRRTEDDCRSRWVVLVLSAKTLAAGMVLSPDRQSRAREKNEQNE